MYTKCITKGRFFQATCAWLTECTVLSCKTLEASHRQEKVTGDRAEGHTRIIESK